MPRKRKKPYFGEREEQAVVDYINTNSSEIRHKIYVEVLRSPFQKMIQSILRKYPIHIGNYDIEEVEANALSHLIEQMVKFNPDKILPNGNKAKAFSYCQTIVRNYYKDHSKKSYTEKKINLCYDDFTEEVHQNTDYIYEMSFNEQSDVEKLVEITINKIKDKINGDETLKENEINVGDAIVNILENWHKLFLEDSPDGKYDKKISNQYQKNKILLFLKEQTNLTTKEIRVSMKPFKEIYMFEKYRFYNDE